MRRLDFSLTNPSMMFRWSRARDREEPGAGPRVVRGAGESRQQGRQAEVRGQAPGGGRSQPGVGPPQLGRLHAEADQHQGGPGGGELDGNRDLDRRTSLIYHTSHHLGYSCSWRGE